MNEQNTIPNTGDVIPVFKRTCKISSKIEFLWSQCTPSTKKDYYAILYDFLQFYGKTHPKFLSKVTDSMVLDYKDYLVNQKPGKVVDGYHVRNGKLAEATIKKRLTVMSSIYSKLVLSGLLKSSPFVGVRFKNSGDQKSPNVALTLKEIRVVLKYQGDDFRGIRGKAIIACMVGGALRISECLNLKWQDVIPPKSAKDQPMFYLRQTKNGKSYHQPCMPSFWEHIQNYRDLLLAEGYDPSPDSPFWPEKRKSFRIDPKQEAYMRQYGPLRGQDSTISTYPRPVYRGTCLTTLNSQISRAGQIAGLPFPLKSHNLRTSAATILAEDFDIQHVRAFLRHKSIETTASYIKSKMPKMDIKL